MQRFFSAICQNGQKRKKLTWDDDELQRGYYAINQNGKIFGTTTSTQQLGLWGDALKTRNCYNCKMHTLECNKLVDT